ncbi:Glutamate receptor ionotropic [Mactra antiquata]
MKWNKVWFLKGFGVWVVACCMVFFMVTTRAFAKQEVVMQIIMPYHSSAESKIISAHLHIKQTINFGREKMYENLRSHFVVDSWEKFIETQSPSEILSTFCNEIFQRHVNTLLCLNHGFGTEASNNYILQLAENVGYPVISWDPHYPGALQVGDLIYEATFWTPLQ